MKKFTVLATTLVASTLSLSLVGNLSKAEASSLVPTKEGEIKLTGSGCVTSATCLDTTSLGYTVTSLNYDPQFSLSLLFVDKRDTANNYSSNNYSSFDIQFLAQDAGTNPALGEYWLRPVAYTATTEKIDSPRYNTSKQTIDAPAGASIGTVTNTTPTTTETTTTADGKKIITTTTVQTTTVTKQAKVNGVTKLIQEITTKTTTQKTTITPGKPVEKGQLEVGKFQFNFKNPLAGLKVNFFDVEDSNHTGILSYTNSQGTTISIPELLAGKENGNVQSLVINDVVSFVVQLGNPGKKYGYNDSQFGNTGDGVDLQLETVPEPANMAGLGALALASIFSLRKSKKSSQAA